jgi:hypothetical protein
VTSGTRGVASGVLTEEPRALPVLRGESVTPQEEVAAAVADTIEQPEPPLRVPVGLPAERALRARKEAPESEPFLMAAINW